MFFVSFPALSVEPTPRPALKRTRNRSKDPSTTSVVNGSSDVENGLDDEGGMLQLTLLS